MGEIFLAEDTRLRRSVALKFLPEAVRADPDRLRRFEHEARLASALNHPHIAQIYELDDWDGRPLIAMEYVEGQTLADHPRPIDPQSHRFTPDGWFRTGDLVSIHPDGSIQIRDRTKDVIKSGGEWVSSVALENAIMGHCAVAEAAVIGVPEAKWMERPIAIVVCKPGQTVTHEALVAFLEPQFPKWWMPDATEFVDVLPKSGAGKFQKSVLRERFARRLTAGWEKAR